MEKRRLKRSDFPDAVERIQALPAERRAKIEAGAAKILAEMHLAELRKAMDVTQAAVAERSGMKQAEISRIERAPETAKLQTLERYVEGVGGSLSLIASFPDGTRAEIGMRNGKPVKSRISTALPSVDLAGFSVSMEEDIERAARELVGEDRPSTAEPDNREEDRRRA